NDRLTQRDPFAAVISVKIASTSGRDSFISQRLQQCEPSCWPNPGCQVNINQLHGVKDFSCYL
ncbi:hypothetical protein ILYODFUR_032404, partial [Ilyodon furcidens]